MNAAIVPVNGDRARDKITKFEGIVTGEFNYLNGCRRVCITAETLGSDGKVRELVFDIEQVEVVAVGAFLKKPEPKGGPMADPPPR